MDTLYNSSTLNTKIKTEVESCKKVMKKKAAGRIFFFCVSHHEDSKGFRPEIKNESKEFYKSDNVWPLASN